MSHYDEKAGAFDARGPEPNDDKREHNGALSALDATDPVELRRALLVYGTAGPHAPLHARVNPGARAS
jgi:hypothetical protein